MAIGPEQLDLKKLAQIFVLDGSLESRITKELIREILESFKFEDWDKIRPNIQDYSDAKKQLRDLINKCEILLGAMSYSSKPRRGQFLTPVYSKLKEAVDIARLVLQTQADDNEGIKITNGAISSLRQILMSSIFSCVEDGYLSIDNKWFSNGDYCGALDWTPFKKICFEPNLDMHLIVTPYKYEDLPSSIKTGDCYYVEGIYVEYMGEIKDENGNLKPQPKNAIITRKNVVEIQLEDEKPKSMRLCDLGGEMEDIEIIDGALFLEAGLLIIADDYDVDFGPIVSSYLKRPINTVPVKFECDGAKMHIEKSIKDILVKSELISPSEIDTKFIISKVGSKLLNMKEEAEVELIEYTSDRYHITAFGNNEILANVPVIYVDNTNRIISGISAEAIRNSMEEGSEQVLYTSNGTSIYLNGDSSILLEGRDTKEYILVEDLLLVEQNAVEVNYKHDNVRDCKYFSKYRPADSSKHWIPTALVGQYYISPEPIDSDLRLYKDNPEIKQVVGILDENMGILYTRMPELLVDPEKVTTGEIVNDYTELIHKGLQYQFKVIEMGYYDGHLFGKTDVFIYSETNPRGQERYNSLINYIKYMDVFKGIELPETLEVIDGKDEQKEKYHLVIESSFNPIYINTHKTNTYYWQGDASDIVYLPDTKEDCLTYLSISGFKSNPTVAPEIAPKDEE